MICCFSERSQKCRQCPQTAISIIVRFCFCDKRLQCGLRLQHRESVLDVGSGPKSPLLTIGEVDDKSPKAITDSILAVSAAISRLPKSVVIRYRAAWRSVALPETVSKRHIGSIWRHCCPLAAWKRRGEPNRCAVTVLRRSGAKRCHLSQVRRPECRLPRKAKNLRL